MTQSSPSPFPIPAPPCSGGPWRSGGPSRLPASGILPDPPGCKPLPMHRLRRGSVMESGSYGCRMQTTTGKPT